MRHHDGADKHPHPVLVTNLNINVGVKSLRTPSETGCLRIEVDRKRLGAVKFGGAAWAEFEPQLSVATGYSA